MKITTLKNDGRTKNALKKLFAVTVSGAFAVVPLFGAIDSVEAQRRNVPNSDSRRDTRNFQTVTGRVTNVQSGERFDIVVGSTTYNVFVSTRLPRRLSNGDVVRVYGERSGSNDIRNASVAIVSNQNNNPGNVWDNRNNGAYQTHTGRVVRVESDQRFDIAVGNTTYDVYASTRLPRRLSNGDIVRVYGQRSGSDDLRNASVVIISNQNNNRPGNNQNAGYQTHTGRVTNVQSNDRFGLVVGNTTYDVYASTRLPRRLDEGDVVRVYGQRSGSDDLRNASVVIISNQNNNRPGINRPGDNRVNPFVTVTGVVTRVESSRAFDMRVGNRTHRVQTAGALPRNLDRGDTVRVYGQRIGNEAFVNANVAVTSRR